MAPDDLAGAVSEAAAREAFAASLVDADDPGDALTRFYFCFYPRGRRRLATVERDGQRGAAAKADTEHDDVPLVVVRAPTAAMFGELLRTVCEPGLLYLFIVRAADADLLRAAVADRRDEQTNLIYSLARSDFRDSPFAACYRYDKGELFGYRAYTGEVPVSSCSLIWASDRFAEIAVATREDYRGRGFGRAAVAALTREILAAGVTPLYVVSEANTASRRLAESLGYRLTGATEFSCYGTLI